MRTRCMHASDRPQDTELFLAGLAIMAIFDVELVTDETFLLWREAERIELPVVGGVLEETVTAGAPVAALVELNSGF